MKNILFIICLVTTGFFCSAQDLSKSDIFGDWKVEKIVNSPNDVQFQSLSDGFKNATFSFSENGKFTITTTFSSPMFDIFTEKSNNSQWIFEQNDQHLKIGSQKNQYSIMGIKVNQIKQVIFFHLDETELVLEMNKQ